jgi:hypothetical protein
MQRRVDAVRELRDSTRCAIWIAGSVLVALVAAGCGDDPGEPGTAPTADTSNDSSQPSSAAAPDPATEVEAITLVRRGGLAGEEKTWRVRPDDAASDRAFRLAARRSALRAEVADLVKQPPACCDFFVYHLTLRYADGTALRAVLGEEHGHGVLSELVSEVASTQSSAPTSPLR